MVKTESCALCLTSKSKWFLDIFCEDSQSMEMGPIISKYLWFELKPSEHCYVCAECWKNVHDFHLFYCKLEKIHLETNELDSKTIPFVAQPAFEFHPIDEVKLEPPDEIDDDVTCNETSTADDVVEKTIEKSIEEIVEASTSAVSIPDPEPEADRPKKSSSTPIGCKAELSDSDGDDVDFLADDGGFGFDDDNDDEDKDKDYVEEKKDVKPKDIVAWVPKKRRGRPPKGSLILKLKKEPGQEQTTDADGTLTDLGESSTALEKKVAKKRKKIKKDPDEAAGSGSDYENGDKKKERQSSRRTKDERLFSYITEFVCYLCPERVEFERFHHANLHYRELHDEPAYLKCPKCDKKCYSPGGLINHMETHDDPEKNKCPICGRICDQKITLKKHMRAHRIQMEVELPYSCDLCPRRFETIRARDKHERLHGRKVFIKKEKGRDEELLAFYKKVSCEICENANPTEDSACYNNFWNLKHHMITEHNKTPYLKCPLCSKKNVCRQQLMVHVDVHENPDRYRCDVCGEVFQFLEKHKLKVHGKVTEPPEEKNYGCEHCGKMFHSELNLKNHIDRVHAVKDVLCEICNKPFSKKALSAHKRSAHTDEMFMCEQCPKMFKTRSGLESHKGEHDADLRKPVNCKICGKEMRRGASLAKHMKVIHSQEEPVNCNLCGKQFRTKFHMIRHRTNTCAATIDSRPFKCEVCGKGFSMRLTMTEHMTTHTRTSLYQCAFCFKTFGYISNLYKHRKKAHPEEWQEVQARPEQGIATVIEMRN